MLLDFNHLRSTRLLQAIFQLQLFFFVFFFKTDFRLPFYRSGNYFISLFIPAFLFKQRFISMITCLHSYIITVQFKLYISQIINFLLKHFNFGKKVLWQYPIIPICFNMPYTRLLLCLFYGMLMHSNFIILLWLIVALGVSMVCLPFVN